MTTNKTEFNLLSERWIAVMKHDGSTEDVGLFEAFERAHQFRGLAGELPTQDIAVLRLLLAVLHSVFGRYDPDGWYAPLYGEDPPVSPREVFQRWHAIWEQGQFSNSIIKEYLENYKDNFWLFHPDRPFYQVPGLDRATDYTAAKLNGELAESGNKIRLFSSRGGTSKGWLTYAEAARWLLYVNGYDDTSAKPKGKNLPSPGAGWLGKLGLVIAVGQNLFETLMLNLVMLKDEDQKPWPPGEAVWEEETVRRDERREMAPPKNPAELLTLQSRRLLLKREGDKVVGYSLLGGDFFPPENAFVEQMTVWRKNREKKGGPPEFKPRRHDPSRQLWRDLASLLVSGDEQHRRPGVVSWVRLLKQHALVQRPLFSFQIAAVKYGDKDFFVDDVFSDGIAFHADLLEEWGEHWITRILDNIRTTDSLVKAAGGLAQDLARAAGDSDAGRLRQAAYAAREQAYYRLDRPFRRWLEQIDPVQDEPRNVSVQWWEQAQRIVRKLGREMVDRCGPQAFAGRVIIGDNKKEHHYSVPRAYNYFLYQTATFEHEEAREGEPKTGAS